MPRGHRHGVAPQWMEALMPTCPAPRWWWVRRSSCLLLAPTRAASTSQDRSVVGGSIRRSDRRSRAVSDVCESSCRFCSAGPRTCPSVSCVLWVAGHQASALEPVLLRMVRIHPPTSPYVGIVLVQGIWMNWFDSTSKGQYFKSMYELQKNPCFMHHEIFVFAEKLLKVMWSGHTPHIHGHCFTCMFHSFHLSAASYLQAQRPHVPVVLPAMVMVFVPQQPPQQPTPQSEGLRQRERKLVVCHSKRLARIIFYCLLYLFSISFYYKKKE